VIRSFNHSSYPRVGNHPLDQQIRTALRARERGALTDDEVDAVTDEVTTLAVAEQSRAFIDIVTDGMIRWSGPLSHLARQLDGLELRGLRRWFDTNFYDWRVAVVGPVRRRGAFLLHDFHVAERVAKKPVKVTLPGPVSFARSASIEDGRSVEAVAHELAQALAAEVAELAGAGVRYFQLDEPLLCRHPGDLDLVGETAARIFEAAGAAATTILGTYFGDLAAVGPRLDRLPGTHLGLEVAPGHANLGLLAGLPAGKGVALGLFDARTSVPEDAAEIAAWLAPHRQTLTARDVLVGPNAGLELLPRDQAFDKLLHARYLCELLGREWPWPS
jgi:5-methyltetrahydropteroyltriglutamate--homocysteine methyltransferase